MKNTITLSIAVLISFFGLSQVVCTADFTTSTSGNTANFTNASSGTMFYTWDFGDGNTSSAVSPSHTYATSGTYLVCLTATFNDSITFCMDSTCYNVTVLDTTAGFDLLEVVDFALYPNPASEVITIKIDDVSAATIQIIDLVGREMIQKKLESSSTELNVFDLPSGVYIARIVNIEGQLIGLKKFIRE